ncbi:MAG: hypothetical protein K9H49_09640 [Bacteroidales bacterium]|nr:hypothetical protein [Bacteroidales bacterium]MCF8389917.1 hypothetical protein [Bacteroidales bacterium]
MKKLSILLIAFSIITFSCKKDEVTPEENLEVASATMTYNGQTYTEFDAASLKLVGGILGVKGTEGDGFMLTVIGVGADGTTVNICPDPGVCDNIVTLMLDFGAAVGEEGLVGVSGTVKRTGKKIEISATGLSTASFETKSLTATIIVSTTLDF